MPGLGSTGSKFQLSAGWRFAHANQSYFDSRKNRDFTKLWGPREDLSVLDVSGSYRINNRLRLIATLPIVFNRFSLLLPPKGINEGGIRNGWNVAGLSDISLFGQGTLLDPAEHPFENATIGIGIKCPTGDWDVRRNMVDETGTIIANRAVYPPAIMPGDGGVGILFGYNAFKVLRAPNALRGTTLFSSATYLCNPRNTNGTPSMVASLGVPLDPIFANRLTNSVADTYSMQAGFSTAVPRTWDKPKLRNLRFRTAINLEGLNSRDLIGGNSGFRQPGYTLAVAPGITYSYGNNLFIAEVPIVFNRHINPGATILPGLPTTNEAGMQIPAKFNPNRQMGLVAPVSLSIRYVRTM